MKVHDLKPVPGSTRPRRRVGRGIAGKGGKTAGRGTKGQGARDNIKPGFEGGQLPLKHRIPKLKGLKNPGGAPPRVSPGRGCCDRGGGWPGRGSPSTLWQRSASGQGKRAHQPLIDRQ